jgi:hypothetical protein
MDMDSLMGAVTSMRLSNNANQDDNASMASGSNQFDNSGMTTQETAPMNPFVTANGQIIDPAGKAVSQHVLSSIA